MSTRCLSATPRRDTRAPWRSRSLGPTRRRQRTGAANRHHQRREHADQHRRQHRVFDARKVLQGPTEGSGKDHDRDPAGGGEDSEHEAGIARPPPIGKARVGISEVGGGVDCAGDAGDAGGWGSWRSRKLPARNFPIPRWIQRKEQRRLFDARPCAVPGHARADARPSTTRPVSPSSDGKTR